MANNKNDDRDRMGNLNKTPQGGTQNNTPGTGGPGSTSQGQGGNFNQQTTQRSGDTGSTQGRDPVNKDREMNRDGKIGQGSSGSGSSGSNEGSE